VKAHGKDKAGAEDTLERVDRDFVLVGEPMDHASFGVGVRPSGV